jgi:hypothetical protein
MKAVNPASVLIAVVGTHTTTTLPGSNRPKKKLSTTDAKRRSELLELESMRCQVPETAESHWSNQRTTLRLLQHRSL